MSTSAQITAWDTSDPFYSDIGFDAVSGNFTVPLSGRYSIKATINYSTSATIGGSIGASNPAFSVTRTSPTTADLVSGLFPLLNVSVTLLTLRAILGNGTVTLAGDAELSAGDIIGLFYVADGLNLSLNLGGSNTGGIVWSMYRMT
ncbi:hypothetical protein AALB39_28515 [Lachnospiraceae bacterium 54-53]